MEALRSESWKSRQDAGPVVKVAERQDIVDNPPTPFAKLSESYFGKGIQGGVAAECPGNGIPMEQQSEDCNIVGTSLKTGASGRVTGANCVIAGMETFEICKTS